MLIECQGANQLVKVTSISAVCVNFFAYFDYFNKNKYTVNPLQRYVTAVSVDPSTQAG